MAVTVEPWDETQNQPPSLDTPEGIAAELARLEPLIKQQQKQQAQSATDRRIAELEALFQKQKAELSAPQQQSVPSFVPSFGGGMMVSQPRIELSPEQKASRLGKMLEIKTQIDTLRQQQKPVEAPATAKDVTTPESTKAAPQEAPAAPEAQAQPAMTQQFNEFNQLLNRREQTRARAIDYIKKSLPQEQWLDGMKLVDDYSNQFFKIPDNIAQPVLDAVTMRPIEGLVKIGGKVEKIEKPKVEEDGRSVIGYEGKAPTVQEASKFREYLAETESGSEALDELINLGKTGSMLNPTDRARAGNLAIMIQGKFRPDIVGPGAVTDRDATVLKDVVRNPLSITLADNIVLLEDFKRRMISGKDKKAKILGLKPAAGAGGSGGSVSGQNAPSGSVLMYNPSSKSFSPAR